MEGRLHGSVRTTTRIRAELQAPNRKLAVRYRRSVKTVAKSRSCSTTKDSRMGSATLRSAKLIPSDDEIVVETDNAASRCFAGTSSQTPFTGEPQCLASLSGATVPTQLNPARSRRRRRLICTTIPQSFAWGRVNNTCLVVIDWMRGSLMLYLSMPQRNATAQHF